MSWIELDLSDHIPESRSGGAPRQKFSSKSLLDVDETKKRNDEAVRMVTDKLESLRLHAKRVLADGTAAGGTPSVNPSGVNPSGVNPSGVNPSGVNPSGVNPSGVNAYRARLETQSKLMKSSGLRGAPAACVDRVVSNMSTATAELESFMREFPPAVRKISGATMTELRSAYASAAKEIEQAGLEVEKYTSSYTSRSETKHGDELVEVSLQKVLRLRDDLLASRVFHDLYDAAKYTMDNMTEEDLLFAAGAIMSHMDSLKQGATVPETIEKDAQCIEMAFEEWRREMDRVDHTSVPARGSTPSRALLNQIEDESRRRELETMPSSKAMQLLRHTRTAIARVSKASPEYKKLDVIAQILAVRAGEAGTPRPRPEMIETWRLQKSLVLNHLQRLKAAAQIVMNIRKTIRGEFDTTLQRIKAVHSKTLSALTQEIDTKTNKLMAGYVEFMTRQFVKQSDVVMVRGGALAEAVVSALEMFISAGLFVEDSDRHEEMVQTADYMKTRNVTEYVDVEEESPVLTHSTSQLLQKVYAITIDSFDAWVTFATDVLTTNANGMFRAKETVEKQLQQLRASIHTSA
jgi:hypothetical protein